MKQFLDLVRLIHTTGNFKADRTGTGTYSIFGHQMRFDLSEGFPLVTAKYTHLKSIIHELLWFLQGETNIRYLKAHGVRIWDEWVKEGTAEYVALTAEELRTALVKRFKGHDAVKIGSISAYTDIPGGFDFEVIEGVVNFKLSPSVWNGITADGMTNEEFVFALLQTVCKFYGVETKRLVAGELGPVYGSQWRSWPGVPEFIPWLKMGVEPHDVLIVREDEDGAVIQRRVDQIKNLIEMIKKNPDSRRLIVTAWNPAEVDQMALPPCHCLFQFYSAPMSIKERLEHVTAEQRDKFVDHIVEVRGTFGNMKDLTPQVEAQHHQFLDDLGVSGRKLSCQLYQRSADVFLGVPFNIASYALLTMMIAQVTNHVAGDFIWTGGDCHLYSNHKDQVELLLTRKTHPLPTMKINPEVKDIFGFKFDDFELQNYVSEPTISAPVAV